MSEGYRKKRADQEHGFVLTATSRFLPIIHHKGVLIYKDGGLFVLHNSPTLTNSVGGSVISEPLSDWIQNRRVTDVEPVKITGLDASLPRLKSKQYDLFTFNCEHLACEVSSRPRQSPQLIFWILVLILILGSQ